MCVCVCVCPRTGLDYIQSEKHSEGVGGRIAIDMLIDTHTHTQNDSG